MTDFLDETRKQISDRLIELKPAVDEYSRLQAAAAALAEFGGSGSTAAATAPRRRGPGRPRGSANRTSKAAPAALPVKPAGKNRVALRVAKK